MNPEFKHSLTLTRLVAIPVIIGVLVYPMVDCYMGFEKSKGLFTLMIIWGMVCINREISTTSLKQGLRSDVSYRPVTWCKLISATALSWYAGLLCVFLAGLLGWQHHKPHLIFQLLSLVIIGIALQAGTIAFALHTRKLNRIQSPARLLLLILVAINFADWSMVSIYFLIEWQEKIYALLPFIFFSSIGFLVCTSFAAERSMNNALKAQTLPWAWPLFAVVLAWYIGGFTQTQSDLMNHITRKVDVRNYRFWGLGLNTMVVLTYFNLIFEPSGPSVWQKIARTLRARDWRNFLAHLPLWPTTLILSFIWAWVVLSCLPSNSSFNCALPDLFFGLSPLTLVLGLFRDACLIQVFNLTLTGRFGHCVVLVYFCVFNLIAPILTELQSENVFTTYGLYPIVEFCLPKLSSHIFFNQFWESAMVIAVQAMIALLLFSRQLRIVFSLQHE